MSRATQTVTPRGFVGGTKLYQQRAAMVLPLLVRQARAHHTIAYSHLGAELGMLNPRNLNHVLGTIGRELETLGQKWKMRVPPIQCLAVNKKTGLPGRGFDSLAPDRNMLRKASRNLRRKIIERLAEEAYGFDKWSGVLKVFGLKEPEPPKIPVQSVSRAEILAAKYGAGGESEEHRGIKEYVAANPIVIRLPRATSKGEVEHQFLSGDCMDILFVRGPEWVGVEVKGAHSSENDILRGLFQAVKYQALMEAQQRYEHRELNCRIVIALGGALPRQLRSVRDVLGIEVIERVTAPSKAKVKPGSS